MAAICFFIDPLDARQTDGLKATAIDELTVGDGCKRQLNFASEQPAYLFKSVSAFSAKRAPNLGACSFG